ncbi:MAG: TOBE domain-containing protein [Campylobacterota bacterium]|nr:TOBE domain-containing protein [Campylobacterota bacterium]
MKNFIATVKDIQNVDSLHLVTFDFHGLELCMMSLELSGDITVGRKVFLNVKSTHIAIAKNFSGEVSSSNRLGAKILSVSNGKLLSVVELKVFDTILESIITLKSSLKMGLESGDEVVCFIKASDLYISLV